MADEVNILQYMRATLQPEGAGKPKVSLSFPEGATNRSYDVVAGYPFIDFTQEITSSAVLVDTGVIADFSGWWMFQNLQELASETINLWSDDPSGSGIHIITVGGGEIVGPVRLGAGVVALWAVVVGGTVAPAYLRGVGLSP